MGTQRTQKSQNDFEKYKIGGLTLPDFNIYYYKAALIKIVLIWHNNRYIDGIELRVQKEMLKFTVM